MPREDEYHQNSQEQTQHREPKEDTQAIRVVRLVNRREHHEWIVCAPHLNLNSIETYDLMGLRAGVLGCVQWLLLVETWLTVYKAAVVDGDGVDKLCLVWRQVVCEPKVNLETDLLEDSQLVTRLILLVEVASLILAVQSTSLGQCLAGEVRVLLEVPQWEGEPCVFIVYGPVVASEEGGVLAAWLA